MIIRLGLPTSFRRFSAAALELGAPILVSANALRSRGRFWRVGSDLFGGADVALDSAGFIAMVRYRGYPWTAEEYLDLVAAHPWTWWASMDFCCEPEIADDRATIRRRILLTTEMLGQCRLMADHRRLPPPMPVLQGRRPEDYLWCASMMPDLPELVGVGSVCRRELRGDDGIMEVIAALDAGLPRRVKLHLFGVKGAAIRALAGHPRIHSVDSSGWDFAARRERVANRQPAYTLDYRMSYMRRWYEAQRENLGMFA